MTDTKEREIDKAADEYMKRVGSVDKSEIIRHDFIEGAKWAWDTARSGERPKIICLCGSTRFKDAFDEANYQETMNGNIVLSVGFFIHATGNKHGESIGATLEQKIALDELHKRKIDLADEIFVMNVGGYIGSSTRSEIEYAEAHNKSVRYLESLSQGGQKEK